MSVSLPALTPSTPSLQQRRASLLGAATSPPRAPHHSDKQDEVAPLASTLPVLPHVHQPRPPNATKQQRRTQMVSSSKNIPDRGSGSPRPPNATMIMTHTNPKKKILLRSLHLASVAAPSLRDALPVLVGCDIAKSVIDTSNCEPALLDDVHITHSMTRRIIRERDLLQAGDDIRGFKAVERSARSDIFAEETSARARLSETLQRRAQRLVFVVMRQVEREATEVAPQSVWSEWVEEVWRVGEIFRVEIAKRLLIEKVWRERALRFYAGLVSKRQAIATLKMQGFVRIIIAKRRAKQRSKFTRKIRGIKLLCFVASPTRLPYLDLLDSMPCRRGLYLLQNAVSSSSSSFEGLTLLMRVATGTVAELYGPRIVMDLETEVQLFYILEEACRGSEMLFESFHHTCLMASILEEWVDLNFAVLHRSEPMLRTEIVFEEDERWYDLFISMHEDLTREVNKLRVELMDVEVARIACDDELLDPDWEARQEELAAESRQRQVALMSLTCPQCERVFDSEDDLREHCVTLRHTSQFLDDVLAAEEAAEAQVELSAGVLLMAQRHVPEQRRAEAFASSPRHSRKSGVFDSLESAGHLPPGVYELLVAETSLRREMNPKLGEEVLSAALSRHRMHEISLSLFVSLDMLWLCGACQHLQIPVVDKWWEHDDLASLVPRRRNDTFETFVRYLHMTTTRVEAPPRPSAHADAVRQEVSMAAYLVCSGDLDPVPSVLEVTDRRVAERIVGAWDSYHTFVDERALPPERVELFYNQRRRTINELRRMFNIPQPEGEEEGTHQATRCCVVCQDGALPLVAAILCRHDADNSTSQMLRSLVITAQAAHVSNPPIAHAVHSCELCHNSHLPLVAATLCRESIWDKLVYCSASSMRTTTTTNTASKALASCQFCHDGNLPLTSAVLCSHKNMIAPSSSSEILERIVVPVSTTPAQSASRPSAHAVHSCELCHNSHLPLVAATLCRESIWEKLFYCSELPAQKPNCQLCHDGNLPLVSAVLCCSHHDDGKSKILERIVVCKHRKTLPTAAAVAAIEEMRHCRDMSRRAHAMILWQLWWRSRVTVQRIIQMSSHTHMKWRFRVWRRRAVARAVATELTGSTDSLRRSRVMMTWMRYMFMSRRNRSVKELCEKVRRQRLQEVFSFWKRECNK